jgi:hypothetical protein
VDLGASFRPPSFKHTNDERSPFLRDFPLPSFRSFSPLKYKILPTGVFRIARYSEFKWGDVAGSVVRAHSQGENL